MRQGSRELRCRSADKDEGEMRLRACLKRALVLVVVHCFSSLVVVACASAPPADSAAPGGSAGGASGAGGEGSKNVGRGDDGCDAEVQQKIGPVEGGMDEFVPPPWMDPHHHRKWRGNREHGINDGFNDSELESEAEHMQAQNIEVLPPAWYRQLRLQLRYAQRGKWWENQGIGSNAGSLGVSRKGSGDHEHEQWKKIHTKMEEMCDQGCGHNTPNVQEGREYIRAVMREEDPTRNGRDIMEKMRTNRQRADEQRMREKLHRRQKEASGRGAEDSSGDDDSESFGHILSNVILPPWPFTMLLIATKGSVAFVSALSVIFSPW